MEQWFGSLDHPLGYLRPDQDVVQHEYVVDEEDKARCLLLLDGHELVLEHHVHDSHDPVLHYDVLAPLADLLELQQHRLVHEV